MDITILTLVVSLCGLLISAVLSYLCYTLNKIKDEISEIQLTQIEINKFYENDDYIKLAEDEEDDYTNDYWRQN